MLQLSLPEIYTQLCPDCKKKFKALVKDKFTDEMVTKLVGEH